VPKSPHLLLAAGNVRKLHTNLVDVLQQNALDAIEAEIDANVAQLYSLGRSHFLFAIRQGNRDWRQKISRLYYAGYNVSRAIRLCVSGEYSTEVSDHKKIDALPDDFPDRNTYANRLAVLREDRNVCDYDHVASRGDLVWGVEESVEILDKFLRAAKKYLRGRGVVI
jgi:hypothetical protein